MRLRRPGWWALSAYAVLALAWTARLWLDPAHRQPPNPPDVALFTWFLTWDAHFSPGLHASQIAVPGGVNVMWQTTMVAPGLLLAPLTRLAGAQVTLNLLLTIGPAASAAAAYAGLRRLVAAPAGAFLGGLLYGFSPALLAEGYGAHLHLVLAFLPPLLLVVAAEALLDRRPPVRAGLALGALGGLQLLTGEELLAATALAGLVLLGVLHPPWRRLARVTAGAVPAALVVAGWPLAVQFLGPQRVSGTVQQLGRFREDLAAFVVPGRLLALSGPQPAWPTGPQEVTAYVGLPLLALVAVVAIRRWSDCRVRVAVLLGAALSLASLGPDLLVLGRPTGVPLPWRVVEGLPVFANLLPSRLPVLTALALGLLVAVAVEQWGRRGALAATLALVPLVSLPLPALPVPAVPAYFASAPRGTLLVLPFPNPLETDAMRWQAAAGLSFAMPGGFVVTPDAQGRARFGVPERPTADLLTAVARTGVVPAVGPAQRAEFARDAAYWRLTGVVLGPARHRAALRDTVTALLGHPPTEQGGVQHWAL